MSIIHAANNSFGSWDEFTTNLRARPNEAVTLTLDRAGEELVVATQLTAREDSETGELTGFLGVSPALEKSRG